MGVGDEGSRFAMLASFVSQPTDKELSAKVVTAWRDMAAYRGVFEASTSPMKE